MCGACGQPEERWFAQCPGCMKFNLCIKGDGKRTPPRRVGVPMPMTAPAVMALASSSEPGPGSDRYVLAPVSARPVPITEIPADSFTRMSTGFESIDRILGGGIVRGSAIVIGGEPGSGKSSVMMQILATMKDPVLYATGEESVGQVAERARRTNALGAHIQLVAETDVSRIIEHAQNIRPVLMVVDSIQTAYCPDMRGAAGSVTQVKEVTGRLTGFAKREGITTILSGHVTKDAKLGGPKTLEHLVDVILNLRVDQETKIRVMQGGKNRFGASFETAMFQMTASGLVPCDADPEVLRRIAEGDDEDAKYEPIAQEILNLYMQSGLKLPKWLAERISNLLDLDAWMAS